MSLKSEGAPPGPRSPLHVGSQIDPSDQPEEDSPSPDLSKVLELRLRLLGNGWVCLPSSPATKACYLGDWPTVEPNEFHISNWRTTCSASTNTAIRCDRLVAIDNDMLSDPDLSGQITALAFEHLGPTDFIRVGRAPKRTLIYRREGIIRAESYKLGNGDGLEI